MFSKLLYIVYAVPLEFCRGGEFSTNSNHRPATRGGLEPASLSTLPRSQHRQMPDTQAAFDEATCGRHPTGRPIRMSNDPDHPSAFSRYDGAYSSIRRQARNPRDEQGAQDMRAYQQMRNYPPESRTLPRQRSTGSGASRENSLDNGAAGQQTEYTSLMRRNTFQRQNSVKEETQETQTETEIKPLSREPTYNTLKLSQSMHKSLDIPLNSLVDLSPTEAHAKKAKSEKSSPLSPPRKSQSSSSPEWPPPPDPIASESPEIPKFNTTFDSNTLKKMLRSLPAAESPPDECFDEEYQEPTSTASSPVRRINQNGNRGYSTMHSKHHCRQSDIVDGKKGLRDSGISGMTYDTATSLRSGSTRSARSGKAQTLPPGKGTPINLLLVLV